MRSFRSIRQTCPLNRGWSTISVLLLSSAGYLGSLSSAQSVCDEDQPTPIRVENATGVATLQAALNCAGSGEVEAEWAGNVPVGAPIEVGEGTYLSVTGADDVAEVHGVGSQSNRTRLFEVSQGGGLTLTRLKLSGGSAGTGGAVHSLDANLTLENCVFDGNVATDGSGGAVWADRGAVTIVGGEFLRNNATRYGGAVHATSSSLEVRGGSRFENNTAIGGGALFCGLSDVGSDEVPVSCFITDAEFVSNSAAYESEPDIDDDFSYLDGGGAAMFLFAIVNITDSVFLKNVAMRSGGALHGGHHTNVSVSGCKFAINNSDKFGGAISAASMTLGGGTQLTDNSALNSGGAVFGWDMDGTIIFNDVLCKDNTATENGGCFQGSGRAIFNSGASLLSNKANNGACIYAEAGSTVRVTGGTYTSRSEERGGFMYAADATHIRITGGSIVGNFAGKRGGALYVNGDEEASDILIEGGTFKNNKALESGGAVAVWGAPGLVTITGGTFEKNRAIFYGGFAFLEIQASISCDGATITENYAGDQGGGIYAREATWVNSSCDLVSNRAPQGAAIYLTNVNNASFDDHHVTDNLASGGSVVYVAASTVVARNVAFESSVGLQDYSFNRAVQLDGNTTFDAEKCVFDGWLGDAVVLNVNPANGSLVLDSCDFSGSSAVMAVVSPNSAAEIRNAVVSSLTFENAVPDTIGNALALVDRALDCNDSNACGAGACVDSTLGVLCECLEDGECLHDGGGLSLSLSTRPPAETFLMSSDPVSFELTVSSNSVGTTHAIWKLEFEADHLHLEVVPSSGVLPPGGTVSVSVAATSMNQDIGGNLTSSFVLMTVGDASSGSTVVDRIEVTSAFYLCEAYEYAIPAGDDDSADELTCVQCATISGEEGVDCESPGATKALLPIRPGFWRSSQESLEVYECLHSDACKGATEVSGSDDYCEDGYKGPYCAVCKEGYGRGVGNRCHFCNDTTAHFLFAMGTLFSLVVILLLALAAVFLIGGLDAIDIVRQTVTRKIPFSSNSSAGGLPSPKTSLRGSSEPLGSTNPSDSSTVPAFALQSQVRRGGGDHGIGRDRVFPTVNSEPDDFAQTYARPLGAVVGTGVELSDMSGNYPNQDDGMPSRRHARFSADAAGGIGGVQANKNTEIDGADVVGHPICCGFSEKVKRWLSKLPLDKLKILVVVWQILTVFSSITGVEFPATYSRFLSWINVVNLDIGNIFSASCLLPSANFYVRLLITTLTPLVLAAVLVLTYRMAKRRAGIGRAGVIARRAAWSRHVAAGLLLTFLVFTSASTAAFKIFACDDDVVDGESFLRADFSISCKSGMYTFFQVYAVLMILVYPVGIPVLYAAILWKNRELLNPCIHTGRDGSGETPTTGGDNPSAVICASSKGRTKNVYSPEELQELEEKVQARRVHPELVPSMFLWKDFGPELYYYEVIECGRRILLTGVLIFISPNSATQAAMACIFAFASLLGFELMRPHMDPTDSWLYRLGCVVIFLSNFLTLLIKVDAGEKSNRAAFGVLLVVINVVLVLAVLVTSWFGVQQSVDDSREDETSFAIAKTMLTAERFAANSTRLARSGRVSRPSAASPVRPNFPRSDRGEVWRGPASSRVMHGTTATAAISEDAMPGLVRDGGVSAATLERLQHQSEVRSTAADIYHNPTQSWSPALL